MVSIIKFGRDIYHDIVIEKADYRTHNYMLMDSPIFLASVLGFYYYFVNYGGRKLMERRKPFNLNAFMIVYNATQSVVNFYVFIVGLYLLATFHAPIKCMVVTNTTTPHDIQVLNVSHLYFMLKISDLLDTVFMVMRKNYHQITFLHVYHHIGMVIGSYLIVKYIPGGHGAFVGIINSFVHVVMYLYYLVVAMYPEYKKNIWWKKHITHIQLVQFLVLIIHHATALFNPNCSYPKIPLFIYMTQAILMFVLFSNFYYNAYIRPKIKPLENSEKEKLVKYQ